MLSSNIKKSQRNISLPLGFYFIGMFEKANNLISIRKTLKELRYALRQQLEAIHQPPYNVPRFSCSLSIDSNSALKFPAPNPLAPMRWMISKNKVGRSSTGLVKICNK